MKLSSLRYVKRVVLLSLLLLFLLVTALEMILPVFHPSVLANPDTTTVAVDPASSSANPGQYFTVNITVSEVVDLFSWGVKLKWPLELLEVDVENVTEGPFLKQGGNTGFTKKVETILYQHIQYIDVACTLLGYGVPGVSGSGTLVTVTFKVLSTGSSDLELYDTSLVDSTLTEIPHTLQNGYFYTTWPEAQFTYTPKYSSEHPENYGRPIVGENVTFDASASIDPDGGSILNYTWDFGDGTTGTGMIVNHTYTVATNMSAPYNVTLAIMDDDFENGTVSQEVHVYLHDISILEITTPDQVYTHKVATINVTVLNNGSHVDTFNLTTYYNSKLIETVTSKEELSPGENKTFTFEWFTYVDQIERSSNRSDAGSWSNPLNASASDDVYTYSSINQSYQEYRGYDLNTTGLGWTGLSKVEVGIEAKTDIGGDDKVSIKVAPAGLGFLDDEYVYTITSTNDTFFWVDVTGNLSSWSLGSISNMIVKIKYIQVGDTATPIYVDWLPVRISPLNPTDLPVGSYAIWANAYLVDRAGKDFRAGQEEDTIDNVMFGDPIEITQIPFRDVAIENVEVSPTQVAIGKTATVKVEIENKGNQEETFVVKLYENSTEVSNQTVVRLYPGRTTTVPFKWYAATNNTVEGTYNITVYVLPVADENVTTNNMQNLTVLMRLLPEALFNVSSSEPAIGEEVTFDASSSYAPGQPGETIDQYRWDFGDGTKEVYVKDVNLTDTTTHAYANPGTYNAKLTVVDNENLTRTKTERISVQKLNSTITISASSLTVPISLNTTISGSISPVRSNVTVTINYTRVEESTWITLANISTNESGQYSFVWAPTESGAYQVKAFWKGDTITRPAESSLLNVTVIIQDIAVVDVVVSKIRLTTGESLAIDLNVTNKGTATETFNVTVYYNNTLLETKTVTSLAAGADDTVSFNLATEGLKEGVYTIKAVAEALAGETSTEDNTRSVGIVVEEIPPPNIFLYTTAGLAIAIVAMGIYFVGLKKLGK